MLYSVQGATFESIGRLVDRDEASLDMFWLRDETIEESDNLPDPDVLALEAEIDQLVYSLYGLRREEIAIIEESPQGRAANREAGDIPEVIERFDDKV